MGALAAPFQPLCLGLKGLQKHLEFSSRATFLRTQPAPREPDCSDEDGALLETPLICRGSARLPPAEGVGQHRDLDLLVMEPDPPFSAWDALDELFPAPSMGFCPRSSRLSPGRMV